jgi:hypothetical protein
MNVSPQEFAAIEALDFEQIKNKLMHRDGGKGWSRERVDAAEREYRRFLFLMKKYPDELTAPSMEVDRFWHQHILDTAKYARDCEAVFGYFLHHYPYLGLGGEEDETLRQQAGQRMRDLYEQNFGAVATAEAPARAASASESAFCTVTQAMTPAADAVLVNDAAYCTVPNQRARAAVAQPAYCTVTSPDKPALAAGTAFCTVTAAPAYCTVTAAPAYCTVTAAPAYCTVTAAPAYCTVTAEAAYCTVTSGTAVARAGKRGASNRELEALH